MTTKSKIQWTDATWNPVRGCSIVSKGCTNCYAMKQAHRFNGPGMAYEGLTTTTAGGPVWTGKVRLVPELLDVPLRWRKPRRVFVNSMSDLFHESVPDNFIADVFGVMAVAGSGQFFGAGGIGRRIGTKYDKGLTNPKPVRAFGVRYGPHKFQILTKRPLRMNGLLNSYYFRCSVSRAAYRFAHDRVCAGGLADDIDSGGQWPLPNVWLGVSVEDQDTADERIPPLLQTPATVRFLSCEPLLEDVTIFSLDGPIDVPDGMRSPLDWVIVGGESGPGARPCDVAWIRSIVQQCKATKVSVFVKQLGARHLKLRDRKGGDPTEWPDDLRVREFPQ